MGKIKMTTGNKFKGQHTKELSRKSRMRLKAFKKAHPEITITRVVRDIYQSYGTLCIDYVEDGRTWSDPYIFFRVRENI